jgi:hypothetical protein
MTAPGDDRVRYRPPATLLSRGLSRAARLTQRRRPTTYRVVNRLDRKAFAARLGPVLRGREDVAIVRHYYGYLTRRALAAPIVYDFFAVSQQRALRRMSRLLARRYADCFCLNDHGEPDVSDEIRVDLLNRFLTTYYPIPSEFEKKDRRVVWAPVFPGADVGAQGVEAASDVGVDDVEAASDVGADDVEAASDEGPPGGDQDDQRNLRSG